MQKTRYKERKNYPKYLSIPFWGPYGAIFGLDSKKMDSRYPIQSRRCHLKDGDDNITATKACLLLPPHPPRLLLLLLHPLGMEA